MATGSAKSNPTRKKAAGRTPATSSSKSSSKAAGADQPATGRTAAKAPSKRSTKGAKPRNAKSARGDAPFPAEWLERQRELLETERATYLHQAEVLQKEAEDLVADFEPGDVQFDEESGEGDTLSTERERDLALSAQARAAVEEIDHALAKFALGTYGICEVSGEPIPAERLEAIPWARQRIEYKTGGFGPR